MSPGKFVGRFVGIFVLVYVPLMIPWDVLTDAYGELFRDGCYTLFHSFGSHGEVLFEPSLIENGKYDTAIILGNRQAGTGTQLDVDSRNMGYKPTVFFAALMLAMPYPIVRRLKLLVIGVALVQVYVALRVLLVLLLTFGGSGTGLGLFDLGSVLTKILATLMAVLNALPLAGTFVVPALIWGIVAFRRSDLAEFREKLGIGEPASGKNGS